MSLYEDQGLGNGNVILFCLEVVLNLKSDKLIYTPNNKNKKKYFNHVRTTIIQRTI